MHDLMFSFQPLLKPSNEFKTDCTLDITGNIPTGCQKIVTSDARVWYAFLSK
jgi:hypothetical protein